MFRHSKNHQHEPLPERDPIRIHSQELPLVQFQLLCMIGLWSLITTFSARADFVQMNAGAHSSPPDIHTDTGATFMARSGRSGAIYGNYGSIYRTDGAIYERPTVTIPIENSTKRENVVKAAGQVAGLQPVAERNTGVLILGGLALLLWIQRFRRYWI
jgi:hypothetical protein